MSLDTKGYFVKQISHLSKGVVIVASALCQLGQTGKWSVLVNYIEQINVMKSQHFE